MAAQNIDNTEGKHDLEKAAKNCVISLEDLGVFYNKAKELGVSDKVEDPSTRLEESIEGVDESASDISVLTIEPDEQIALVKRFKTSELKVQSAVEDLKRALESGNQVSFAQFFF